MSLLRNTLVMWSLAATGVQVAVAQSTLPEIGDTYIISRDDNRLFRGSHKIYDRMSEGLVEVQYCGRPYYVRYATVAWTELEVQHGNAVRVEYNRGKGWRPICNSPEEQVNLESLGISEDPRVIVQQDGVPIDPVSRFVAIQRAFFANGNKSSKTSYHSAE